jgi:hypothetical protein
MTPLLGGEGHLREETSGLGGVVVSDCRLEVLTDRRCLAQLAS